MPTFFWDPDGYELWLLTPLLVASVDFAVVIHCAGLLASSAHICPLQSPLCCGRGPGRRMDEQMWELKAGRRFQDLCFPFCFLVVLRPGKAKIQVFLSVAYNKGFLPGLWIAFFLLSSWGRKRDLSTFYNPVRNSFEHEYVDQRGLVYFLKLWIYWG